MHFPRAGNVEGAFSSKLGKRGIFFKELKRRKEHFPRVENEGDHFHRRKKLRGRRKHFQGV